MMGRMWSEKNDQCISYDLKREKKVETGKATKKTGVSKLTSFAQLGPAFI
jgi:hypothetical protein